MNRQAGSVLVTGMMLLALVTSLALAAAAGARVELQLARNERFRENAATAASAGLETAILQVTASSPESVPGLLIGALPGTADHFESRIRFLGYETTLPQPVGARLAGAHFEILGTGYSGRNAIDRQRAIVMRVVESPGPLIGRDCEPVLAGVRCAARGELRRLAWQRLP